MSDALNELGQHIAERRPECVLAWDVSHGELNMDITPANIEDFVEFLKSPIAHEVWMAQKGFLTPHKGVNTEVFTDPTVRKMNDILLQATTFRFDGSDLMPGAVGAGSFWTGMVDFVGGKSAEDVAKTIQASWDGIK